MKITIQDKDGRFINEHKYPRWFIKNHRWITDFDEEYLLITLTKQKQDFRVGFVNEKQGRLDQLRYPKSIHIRKEGADKPDDIIPFPQNTHLHSLFEDAHNACVCAVWTTERDPAKI